MIAARPAGWLRPWLQTSIATVVSVALLVVAYRFFASGRELALALERARWQLCILPLLGALANVMLAAVRWRALLQAGGHQLPLGSVVRIVLAAWPAASITRAGDLLRAHYALPELPVSASVNATVAEKLIDLSTLCSIAAFAALARGFLGWSGAAFVLLVLIWLAVLAAFWGVQAIVPWTSSWRVVRKAERAAATFVTIFRKPKHLAVAVVVSFAAFTNAILIEVSLLWVFGVEVPLADVFWAWPLATFVGILPISLSGIGTRDLAFVWLLGSVGVALDDRSGLLLATFGYAVVTTWFLSLVALPLTWWRRHSVPSSE